MTPALVVVAAPDIHVWVQCPGCGHTWHDATIVPGAWWARGLTPETLAKVPHCPQCSTRPPMRVVEVPA